MILKIKHGDSWEFIDNIDSATLIMETEIQPSGFIAYERHGETCRQLVSDGCYLLNDKGQTVEKLV